MDPRLRVLIDDYLAAVLSAVTLLEQSGIPRPGSNVQWACNGIAQTGVLQGGIKYFKHGYGCTVHLKGGLVDFDFGDTGEIDGFDVWRLAGFARKNLVQYGWTSESELKTCFDAEVAAGSIVCSRYIVHYLRDAAASASLERIRIGKDRSAEGVKDRIRRRRFSDLRRGGKPISHDLAIHFSNCPDCSGRGQVGYATVQDGNQVEVDNVCPRCGGEGFVRVDSA